MPEITFYLKPGTSPRFVYVSIYCNNGRLRCSTGIKLNDTDWEKGWIKSTAPKTKELRVALSQLQNTKSKVDKHLLNCDMNDKPVLSHEVEELIRKKCKDVKTDFFSQYDHLIEMAKSGELLTPRKKRYEASTMKSWNLNKNLIKTFSIEKKKLVEPGLITEDTVKAFITWMNRREHAALNYVSVQLRQWRTILKIMHNEDYHNSLIFAHPVFMPVYETVDKISLSEDDVLKLYRHNLSAVPIFDECRDRWILMYCTGLRVSDSDRLNLEHLGEEYISLINKKTGKKVVIPYHWMVEELLKKYNGELPPNHHSVTINKNMKEIGKACGFTQKFTYKITRGGVMTEETKFKWELLTNHSARRSIVTNMIRNNISHDVAGDMMGMSPNTWKRYNKLTGEDKAGVLRGFKIFQK